MMNKSITQPITQEFIFRHAYFRAMLISRCHSFGKCLFSSHAYFRASAYYQEYTVFLIIILGKLQHFLFMFGVAFGLLFEVNLVLKPRILQQLIRLIILTLK